MNLGGILMKLCNRRHNKAKRKEHLIHIIRENLTFTVNNNILNYSVLPSLMLKVIKSLVAVPETVTEKMKILCVKMLQKWQLSAMGLETINALFFI